MLSYGGLSWLGRPIVLVCIVLIILTLFFSIRGIIREKNAKKQTHNKVGDEQGSEPLKGKGNDRRNPVLSFPLAIFLLIVFPVGAVMSLEWPTAAMRFPLVTCIPASLFVFVIFVLECGEIHEAKSRQGSFSSVIRDGLQKALMTRAVLFIALLVGVILLSMLVGQKIALPVLMGFYLISWGKYSKRLAFSYSAIGYVFLVGFYDRAMNIFWYPSWVSTWLPEYLPTWLPQWLFV
jgi:NADH:ubiquinone oxidoreductase subunit 3 (subunit A)